MLPELSLDLGPGDTTDPLSKDPQVSALVSDLHVTVVRFDGSDDGSTQRSRLQHWADCLVYSTRVDLTRSSVRV